MKVKKLLSVLAAASLAMTSFAALAVTASAASTVNLATLTGHYVAQDGDVLTGTLGGNYKITIAEGAAVTLRDATINGVDDYSYNWAGITPLGDATIVLEGTNTVKGFRYDHPGIFAAVDKTLTIKGSGSLTASSNGYGAGIGGGYDGNGSKINCGNIVIEGGTITATSSQYSAGIGGGTRANCGNIVIKGGNVTATGGFGGAGIGGGYNGTCGSITIEGGTVTAKGGYRASAIGSGDEGTCGNITIADSVTSVTATKGLSATYSIGSGIDGSVGTVTIGGVEGAISESPYTYIPTTVKGKVTDIAANNEGTNSDGTSDNGATAFVTKLTQSGDGAFTVSRVTWTVTSPANDGESKIFIKLKDELPTMTFDGDKAEVTLALAIDGLYDPNASADVSVE